MWLFVLFVLIPIVEIALFIQVGGAIGLWPTLLVVVLTAMAGTTLLRQQGRAALARLQGAIGQLSDPSEPLAEGAMILFAGALLLTPGFFTDAVGLLLMVPGVRHRIFAALRERMTIQMASRPVHPRRDPLHEDVIDGSFEEVIPDPNRRPSGWTEH